MAKKLKILYTAVCRTPIFAPNHRLKEKWPELKELIKNSAPGFYQLVQDYDTDDLVTLSPKIGFTIWKYFNRARYRPTPFGAFAAVSLVSVSAIEKAPIVLKDTLLIHRFTDWKETENQMIGSAKQARAASWYMTNSTMYIVGGNIRYIRLVAGVFEVASVSRFIQLDKLLAVCREKAAREIVYSAMTDEFGMKEREIAALLAQAIALQLLLTENAVNVTGQDYFQRAGVAGKNAIMPYLISERKLITGALAKDALREIPEVIGFLTKYLPAAKNQDLADFRAAFLKKFEHRAVPLMTAMDMEVGIGYGNLGEQQSEFRLSELLSTPGQNEKKETQIRYTKLHRFLLDRLIEGSEIRLELFKDDIPGSSLPLPNTLSVLLHFSAGRPVIENMGGCTANTMLGRFTIAITDLEDFCHEITAVEENSNPGVLFFDVAYQLEREVDNVNRRKRLYPYELPLLTWSCDETPLSFDDTLVTVRDDEIILWSKKHRKRMVPRIPSAYNYSRSELAVFRFLCDLQHQRIKSDLNFKLPYFFPDLNRYPRVCYKKVVVSPASWKLPDDLLKSISMGTPESSLAILGGWLSEQGINFLFKAGQSDQTLCFDPASDKDIKAFLYYCRQHVRQTIYISEALVADYEVLTDNADNRHTAQFIVSYGHEDPVYSPFELDIQEHGSHAGPVIPPGGDWLYFEIYCHPARTNDIITININRFLRKVKHQLRKWFFIRYDDPLPHLRLRLHIKDIADAYPAIGKLKAVLEADLNNGLVSDMQVKTYFPESERYGAERMEMIEALFHLDSKYVLKLLSKRAKKDYLYALTLVFMQRTVAAAFTDAAAQVRFVKELAGNFSRELKMHPESFKRLNQRYRQLTSDYKLDRDCASVRLPVRLDNAYKKVFRTAKNVADLHRLLADVLHMHINRLFSADQRAHEGILYQYLMKSITARHSRQALSTVCSDEA